MTAEGRVEEGVRGVGGSEVVVIGCPKESLSSMMVSRLAFDRDTMFTLKDVNGSGCVGLISLRMGMVNAGLEDAAAEEEEEEGGAVGCPGNVHLVLME